MTKAEELGRFALNILDVKTWADQNDLYFHPMVKDDKFVWALCPRELGVSDAFEFSSYAEVLKFMMQVNLKRSELNENQEQV